MLRCTRNRWPRELALVVTSTLFVLTWGCVPALIEDLPTSGNEMGAIQGESGTGDGSVMTRGRAVGQRTALLYSGQTRTLTLQLEQSETRSIRLRYSNDNGGSATETVQVLVNAQAAGEFVAADTGANLTPGEGWNVFVNSDPLGPVALHAGENIIEVYVVAGTGDGYGFELDQIELVLPTPEEQAAGNEAPEEQAAESETPEEMPAESEIPVEVPAESQDSGENGLQTVPDLYGRSLALAQTDLQSVGLTIGLLSHAASDDAPLGTVMAQVPDPGTPVQPESGVDVTVSIGRAMRQPIHRYDFPIDAGDERYYTTIQTDCGILGGDADSLAEQAQGALHLRGGDAYIGFWHSLSGLANEQERLLDPQAILPWPINQAHQARAVAVYVLVRGASDWKTELKTIVDGQEVFLEAWPVTDLSEDAYVELVWPIDTEEQLKMLNIVAESGSDLLVDEIGLYVVNSELSELREAFLLSAAQVFRCYDRQTGLVRDRSNWPIGDFDSVPGLGFSALTAAAAHELGMVDEQDAQEIAAACINNILTSPSSGGWLAHFTLGVEADRVIHPGSEGEPTEYSTVDTALAFVAAMAATEMLDMPADQARIVSAIEQIDVELVTNAHGEIAVGMDQSGQPLAPSWTDWGGETALAAIQPRINNRT